MKQIPHYWAGERTLGESARRARVFDPALGEAVAEAPLASVADVQAAVAAAQAALQAIGHRYRLGAASYLQLIVAQQQAQQTRLGLASAQAQRLSDSIALYQAMGGAGQ